MGFIGTSIGLLLIIVFILVEGKVKQNYPPFWYFILVFALSFLFLFIGLNNIGTI